MALATGTRLGVYEITAQIGKGGMGQVYRATDTKLKRQVAVKVLPPSLADDAQRLARFQREAEVLASLNHPNIAAIYGVEESQDVRALVMELVDGEDLSQRLTRGPIALDEALPIARQIAEALEAAHEQGVIHRDLKPANIKVRPDGTVKVLDFGLAKALERRSASGEEGREDAVNSPTITSPAMTEAGMILGTAAYMSPEQARGKLVDKRADIWSFGCVLYEMLTGRRAFDGDGVSETLARILEREPDWTRLPATLSPTIRNYLTRCLHKDPRQRIHDIADVRLALEGAFETVPLPPTTAAPPRTSRVAPIIATVALLAAAALAIPALRYLRQTPAPSLPETRVDLVTLATGDQTSFALSPDGAMVVFVGASDGPSRLWLRSLAATTAQPVIGSEGATFPFWSADSRSVGFFAEGKLKRFDIGGRPPEILVPFGSRGGTWNADGVILFATTVGGLFRLTASGGEPIAATTRDRQQGSHRFPSFLPDGRHFLFLALGTPDTSGIYLGSLDSPKTQRLTPSATAGVYLPSGWLLWVRGGSLVAQRLDLEAQTLTGEPVTVADRVASDPDYGSTAVSVSAAGMVAYRTGGGNRRQLKWFDRSGKALGTLGDPDESPPNSPSVSPDGERVAVHRSSVQGNSDIWLLDGTRTSRFTFDAALDRFPNWSRDGSRIAFDSNRKGRRDLYYKSSAGAGSDELLLESPEDKIVTDWSADGRFIIYVSFGPQTSRDLWVLPMEGDRRPWEFLKTGFEERWAQFSPDGRWVAYQSNESGRDEIYVRPFATPVASGAVATGAAGQWQVSTAGGVFPRWRPDGRELYYIDPMGHMMAARIAVTGATLLPGAPQTLFATAIVGGGVDGGQGRHYDVSRDGRFLINSVIQDPLAPITLLQHWNPEAKK